MWGKLRMFSGMEKLVCKKHFVDKILDEKCH